LTCTHDPPPGLRTCRRCGLVVRGKYAARRSAGYCGQEGCWLHTGEASYCPKHLAYRRRKLRERERTAAPPAYHPRIYPDPRRVG